MIPPNTFRRLERLEALAQGGHPAVHRLIINGDDSAPAIAALIASGRASATDLFICRTIYEGVGSR